MNKFITLLALILMCLGGEARAADICKAVAERQVEAIENSDAVLRSGEALTAVTQYRIEKATGIPSLCSHGGYCYPTQIDVGGLRVEAMRLLNCSIRGRTDGDGEFLYYGLKPVRSSVSNPQQDYDELTNQLSELGLCSSCSDNIAQYLIRKPTSKCAQLARSALNGNNAAINKLNQFPDYCTWNY